MKIDNPDIIFDNIDSGIIILDENLNIIYWNRWLEIRTKIKKTTIIEKNICSYFPYIKEKKLKRKINTTLALNSPSFYSAEQDKYLIQIPLHNVTSKMYEYMQQNITIVPYDKDKREICIYIYDQTSLSDTNAKLNTTLQNIQTYKHELEKKMQIEIQNNIALQNIMDTNKQMLIISDGINITFANSSFLNFVKLNKIDDFSQEYNKLTDLFVADKSHLFDGVQEDDHSFMQHLLSLNSKDRTVSIVDKSTNNKLVFLIDTTLIDAEKSLYLWNFTDITEIALDTSAMEYKVFHDPLTKVYNRHKLEEVLSKEILEYNRYNKVFCIAIIDIDFFKKFNDTYGHLIGDEVLVSFAQAINENIRSTDIFARWGGEEFVALFTNTDLDEIQVAIKKIQLAINDVEHKTAGKITASFGLTEVKQNDTNETIFKRADEALYSAKENGRNRFEIKK